MISDFTSDTFGIDLLSIQSPLIELSSDLAFDGSFQFRVTGEPALATTFCRDLQEIYVFDHLKQFKAEIEQKALTDEDKARLLMAALTGGKHG